MLLCVCVSGLLLIFIVHTERDECICIQRICIVRLSLKSKRLINVLVQKLV